MRKCARPVLWGPRPVIGGGGPIPDAPLARIADILLAPGSGASYLNRPMVSILSAPPAGVVAKLRGTPQGCRPIGRARWP